MSRKLSLGVAALTILTAGLSACSSDTNHSTSNSSARNAATADYAINVLTRYVKADGAAELFTPKTVTDALPNVRYYDGSHYIHYSTLVATGSFGSFTTPQPRLGTDSSEPADAGSNSPPWKLVISQFRVASKVANSAEGARVKVGDSLPVTFYLPPDTDSDAFGASLAKMGNTVVFLTGGFQGSTTWDIADNALLGAIKTNTGKIRMSVATTGEGTETEATDGIIIDADTVAELKKAAATPETIEVGPAATSTSGTPSATPSR
ncbi:hypothetical protein SAMN05443575_1613 [Jatrophihabitans endophyticus]|uniref:Lipoprotein n=1 Tax=Jatrophihabitans endophyticus TaxID=1206085 RepID=A0A1M5HRP2_9ACTN|nr:hypothetical protein [Jatrophihabitans endophyticus]SHG18616.1 hypothetical protein SAMN05443575_1613 [Jatrophihabitans endophyticus]